MNTTEEIENLFWEIGAEKFVVQKGENLNQAVSRLGHEQRLFWTNRKGAMILVDVGSVLHLQHHAEMIFEMIGSQLKICQEGYDFVDIDGNVISKIEEMDNNTITTFLVEPLFSTIVKSKLKHHKVQR